VSMRFFAVGGLSVLLLLASPVLAQEGPVTFEFSFSNPGARSLGLAGAFAGLADDATAAFANPAGLVQLLEPEFSIEGRTWSLDTEFVQGGRANGEPTGEGVDVFTGPKLGVSSSETSDVSFASFVYPAGPVSLAVYRHTWADFQLNSRVDSLFGLVDGELERSEDILASTHVRVVNTGLAIGLKVSESFSLGLGAVYFDAVMDSFSAEHLQAEEDFFEANPFTPELLETSYSYMSQSDGWVGHAGFLVQPSPRWSLGGFYRQGPELELRVLEVAGPAADESEPGQIELDAVTPLRLPDVYGLGLALRTPAGGWTFSFEWAHVTYSSITDSLDTAVFDSNQIVVEDGDELHAGIEYVFSRSDPIVGLRLGAWRDPDHRVSSGPEADTFEAAIFRGGGPEDHVSAGLGLVFPRVQLDLGLDVSDRAETASISLVFRF